jgi:hypothetical protein
MSRATKEEIIDCVDFAVKSLQEVTQQLNRIERLLAEPLPEHLKFNLRVDEQCAFALGRAESIAHDAVGRMEFVIEELQKVSRGRK